MVDVDECYSNPVPKSASGIKKKRIRKRKPQQQVTDLVCHFSCAFSSEIVLTFLTGDALVRTNRHAIAMMFVRPSVWDGRAL